MGVERFQEANEDPAHEAKPDPPRDTANPGLAERSAETAQPGDAARPEQPAPDNSRRESQDSSAAKTEPAEPRTRTEYADQVAPPGSPPIPDDPPTPEADEEDFGEPMPPGHWHTEKSHSLEEPDEQYAEAHWDERDLDTGSDSSALREEQPSLGRQAVDPDQPDNESAEPDHDPEKTHDAAETDSGLGQGRETTDEPDDTREPSAVDEPDGPPPDVPPTRETDLDESLSPELPATPEPNDKTPIEGHPTGTEQGTEIDEGTHPLTDQEWAEHLTEVRDGLEKAHAEGLGTDHKYTIDPDHLRWNRERRQLHKEIVEAIYVRSENVPCDHSAIMAGGLGGAGKTTILKEQANVDLTKYLMINPDDIKEEMARRGLVPEIDGLSPMESSDLVHEESSAIAKSLARRAYSEGRNLIWDITMSSFESTAGRIRDMREAGYTSVDGIFVDIPIDTSIRRVEARHRLGHDEFRAGHGLGGRFVPSEVIKAQADGEYGSRNRRTFENLKDRFDRWYRYDNSIDGQRATLAQANVQA